MDRILKDHKICAILRKVPLEKTLEYAGAAFDGGVRMFEVALNSPDACRQITMLRQQYGDKAAVGAGTAITGERIRKALDAGAQFMLTPSACEEPLAYCRDNSIPLLPGVMTPTDVAMCLHYGFHTLKLFPAGDLPAGYIKSLQGPFDGTAYVAVGGVGPDNIKSFFERGFIGVGIGSSLIPKAYVEAGEWDKARDYVRAMVERAAL